MAENVTEKHKKPIENAWDLVGEDLMQAGRKKLFGGAFFGAAVALVTASLFVPMSSNISTATLWAAGVCAIIGLPLMIAGSCQLIRAGTKLHKVPVTVTPKP